MRFCRFFGVALTAILLSVNFTSCSKSEDNKTSTGGENFANEKRLVKLVEKYTLNSTEYEQTTTFKYDDKKRVIESHEVSKKSNGATSTFDAQYIWGDDVIQFLAQEISNEGGRDEGPIKYTQELTIKNGLVQSLDDEVVSYNSKGRYNETVTWDNDKLVYEQTGDIDYRYTYKGVICQKGYFPLWGNLLGGIIEGLFTAHPELVGIRTQQLPANAICAKHYIDSSKEGLATTYEYEFDNEGYITKITIQDSAEGSVSTYTLTWE